MAVAVVVALAVALAVGVDSGKSGGGCGCGRGGGVGGKGLGEGGREGSGQGGREGAGRGALIFDKLLISLHFSQSLYHSFYLLLVSQQHILSNDVCFLYLLPLLAASQPHPLP